MIHTPAVLQSVRAAKGRCNTSPTAMISFRSRRINPLGRQYRRSFWLLMVMAVTVSLLIVFEDKLHPPEEVRSVRPAAEVPAADKPESEAVVTEEAEGRDLGLLASGDANPRGNLAR